MSDLMLYLFVQKASGKREGGAGPISKSVDVLVRESIRHQMDMIKFCLLPIKNSLFKLLFL